MKKKPIFILFLSAIIFYVNTTTVFPDTESKKNLSLVEEDKQFWDMLLNEKSVNNKNLLYASYIAYKDKLNDLSIETFQECAKSNSTNSIISGVSVYYIGKNLFLIGKYAEAIAQFRTVENYELANYNYIKYAALLNTAISYYELGDNEKFRENIQKVISSDVVGNYKKKALDLLTIVQ